MQKTYFMFQHYSIFLLTLQISRVLLDPVEEPFERDFDVDAYNKRQLNELNKPENTNPISRYSDSYTQLKRKNLKFKKAPPYKYLYKKALLKKSYYNEKYIKSFIGETMPPRSSFRGNAYVEPIKLYLRGRRQVKPVAVPAKPAVPAAPAVGATAKPAVPAVPAAGKPAVVGAPTVKPAVAAPPPAAKPAVGAPTVKPAVGAPTVKPAVGAPTVKPAVGAPTVKPAAGAPTVKPAVGAPTVKPAAGVTVKAGVAAPAAVPPKPGVPAPVPPKPGVPALPPKPGAPGIAVRPGVIVTTKPQLPAVGGVKPPLLLPGAKPPVLINVPVQPPLRLPGGPVLMQPGGKPGVVAAPGIALRPGAVAPATTAKPAAGWVPNFNTQGKAAADVVTTGGTTVYVEAEGPTENIEALLAEAQKEMEGAASTQAANPFNLDGLVGGFLGGLANGVGPTTAAEPEAPAE